MHSINRLDGLDSTCDANSAEVTVGSPRAERTETYASARGIESRMLRMRSSKFRVRAFGAAIIVTGMGLFSPLLAVTPTCLPQINLTDNLIAGLAANNFGVTTVTYSAEGGGGVSLLVQEAFGMWNALEAQTMVNFIPASGNNVGDIQVGLETPQHQSRDGCISTTQAYGHINWGPKFLPDLTNPKYARDAQLSFAHEIGHLLGLNENLTKNNSDIMDQSTGCTPADAGYRSDEVPPTAIDGTQAGQCQELACNDS